MLCGGDNYDDFQNGYIVEFYVRQISGGREACMQPMGGVCPQFLMNGK